MAKKSSRSQTLNQKIYDLTFAWLEEQSLALKEGNGAEPSDPLANVVLAKHLRRSDVLEHVQQRDLLLRRTKKQLLEKSVDAVLKYMREEEAKELLSFLPLNGSDEGGELDSDFDGADPNELVDYKGSAALNQLVVSVWSKAETPGTKEPTAEAALAKKRPPETTAKQPTKRHKSRIEHTTPTVALLSLGGLAAVTTQLMELVGLPILHPEIYASTGVEPPRGVLLYGPPGCGKTTVASALAGELQVPLISISAPLVVLGMSGESEKKLREIFEEAKSIAPCLIFMDEIDAITPKRDGGAQREMERRIVAQLLTLMDELTLEKTGGKPVVVLGATNRPDLLDAALRRAGRFDREICLNVPNEEQRTAILRAMTKGLRMGGGQFDFRELAKMTPGFVGADLKSLVTAAGIAAIKRIFESLSELEGSVEEGSMEVDAAAEPAGLTESALRKFGDKSDYEKLLTIQKFLVRHPDPLTEEQLRPLCIVYEDFKVALPTVQPTAKREGFATVPDVTWKNVGALSRIRMELHMCIVQPIKKPELYEKVGITAPAGVLMWGPPGCGKTLLAKAVANESRANFISIKGPEILNKYVGESERAVRQVFQRARASMPCIIFFDELDALVPRRDASLSESSSRVVNALLTELDGLSDRRGVFVVGATNRPDMIDPAMVRPGRLDKTLYIELPSAQERLEILQTLVAANSTPLAPDVDLRAVAHDERCRNFSGADLLSVVREAGVLALKKRFFAGHQIQELDESGYYEGTDDNVSITVTGDDFARALASIKPSVSDKDRLRYERLNKKMGWSLVDEREEKPADAAE